MLNIIHTFSCNSKPSWMKIRKATLVAVSKYLGGEKREKSPDR